MGSVLDTVRELAPVMAARDAADAENYPAENISALVQAGVLTAPFPASLGGQGTHLPELARIVEGVAAASPSTALLLAMPLGLAAIYGLGPGIAPDDRQAGFAAQSEQVAAEYRAGRIYAACNSEKGAGGSLEATRTTAVRDAGGVFRLTGEKILASFGRHADYFFATAKFPPEQMPGGSVVEFFVMRTDAPGVDIQQDWDGFGMRSTESHSVVLTDVPAEYVLGFPGLVTIVQPTTIWSPLFAAIPLGCAVAILNALGTPAPGSPALRLRLNEALMRVEALRAYLVETAALRPPHMTTAYAARVLRTKTYVTAEATRLAAELFALSGGRHYTRTGAVARSLAASFAGTALRPPLPLALDTLSQSFALDLGEEER